jgi:hypothetical protein
LLEDLVPPKKETRCKVRNILHDLEPGDVQILLKALADQQSWSHEALATALRERGLEISAASISRHRIGKCTHD